MSGRLVVIAGLIVVCSVVSMVSSILTQIATETLTRDVQRAFEEFEESDALVAEWVDTYRMTRRVSSKRGRVESNHDFSARHEAMVADQLRRYPKDQQ